MIFRIHCPDFMSYVYRLHSILCVLLLSEGTNLHVASFNSCSDSYVFFRCSHIYEAHFSCKFFSFCMPSRVYVWIVLPIHPFRLPWSFVAGGTWPFSHGAAGLVHVIRTHGF